MKRIAVVNDLSGLGRCSLTAALPVLSALKTECCPLPTAILSNQTGYHRFFCDDFTDRIDPYVAEWRAQGVQFDGILTGYLASAAQVDSILAFLRDFKRAETLYVCDPVMADDGMLYSTYDAALCGRIRELARHANVLTPNLTELCLLTDSDFHAVTAHGHEDDYAAQIAALAEKLRTPTLHTVVVTGVCVGTDILNICVTEHGYSVTKTERIGGSFSGTGDLFSSVLTGSLVRGIPVEQAVDTAVRFIHASIEESDRAQTDRNDGVHFQNYLQMLIQ